MKLLLLLLGSVWSVVSCSDGRDARAVAGPVVPVAERSPGCGTAAAAAGQFTLSAEDGKRRSRTYIVELPGHYDATRAYPLVFVFHAAGGSAAQAIAWGLQSTAGAADSAIFVFPNGIPYKNFGVGWDDTQNGYDLPFFDAMLRGVAGRYCVDGRRIFAAGFSWGGDFVTTLSCLRGAVLRAVQVNSATDEYATRSDAATYQNQPCASAGRPATRFEHASGGDPQYPAPLFATTSSLFKQLNGCSGAARKDSSSPAGLACVDYLNCSSGYSECTFAAALGHTLPPDWAATTWAFFSRF